MPYSYTDSGDFNPPPSSSIDSEKLSDDMLALIGHNALFSYLTRLHKYGYVCPLHSFCEKEKYDKDDKTELFDAGEVRDKVESYGEQQKTLFLHPHLIQVISPVFQIAHTAISMQFIQ